MAREGDTPHNPRLAATIAATGLSYAALAARIRTVAAENNENLRTNSAAITHWVNGTRPKPTTVVYLAEALSRATGRLVTPDDVGLGSPDDVPAATGDVAADLARLGRMDVDRRGFLTIAFSLPAAVAVPAMVPLSQCAACAQHGGTVGQAEVDTVRDIVTTFVRADERLGGRVGRSAAVEYLATDATAYLKGRFANAGVRAAMFDAVAELVQLCGWKAHDAGLEGLAQRYYAHAWQLSQDGDHRGHGAFLLRIMAHQAIDMGHGADCIGLAEAAVTSGRGHLDLTTQGQLHLALARTHGACGNARSARASLADAEKCFAAHTEGRERPWWALNSGDPSALLASHTAKTLRSLGDPAAEEHMLESARRWNAATHPRVRALNLCAVGELRAERGHVESACEVWKEALELFGGVDSSRARRAVATMRSTLSPYHARHIQIAVELDESARQWQSTTARV